MPEAERRSLIQPDSTPNTPGDGLVPENQAEGIEGIPPDGLARAREIIEGDGLPEVMVMQTPETRQAAPGYREYFMRAWSYVRDWMLENPYASTTNEVARSSQVARNERAYSEEQIADRERRRELFTIVDDICEKLITLEPVNVEALIGREIKVRTNTYRIMRALGQGGMGITLIAENIVKPGEEVVLKLSHSFDRSGMYEDPEELIDQTTKQTVWQKITGKKNPRIRKYRWSEQEIGSIANARRQIVETASLYKLTRQGEEHTPIQRKDSDPIFPTLVDAQFLVHPDNPDRRLNATVMEKIEGTTLDKEINDETGLTNTDEVVDLTRQLMDGVEHMHSAGVLHLDLKPQNIIVTPQRRLAFIDFGLSDVHKQKKDFTRPTYAQQVSTVFKRTGTASYYVIGQPVGHNRDYYAVGRIMQDMAIGGNVVRMNDRMRRERTQSLDPKRQVVVRAADRLAEIDRVKRTSIRLARTQIDYELAELTV